MNLTWHIVRKDLFRLRWTLLLWGALLTARMVFATIQASLDEASYLPFFLGSYIFGKVFLPLIGFGIIMGVQHDDAVCDSDAYWITRPISGGRLLGAKVVTLLMLSLVPALLLTPWWLAHGFDRSQWLDAAWETTRWQLAITAFAAPFAALAPNISRFLVNTVLTSLALIVVGVTYHQLGFGPAMVDSLEKVDAWVRVAGSLWAAAALAILFNQFLWRRTRRSLAIGVVAVVLGMGAASYIGTPGPASAALAAANSPAPPAPPQVLAALPSAPGSVSLRHGVRVAVLELVPDYRVGVVMLVSESAPMFAGPDWLWPAPPGRGKPPRKEFFFLINRTDGRSISASIQRTGYTLTAPTLWYVKKTLTFATTASWAKNADLVKILADTDPVTAPAEAVAALHPTSP